MTSDVEPHQHLRSSFYLLTYLLTSSTSKLLIANVMKTTADQAFRVTVAWAQNLLPVTLKTCQTQLVFQCVLKMLLRYPSMTVY